MVKRWLRGLGFDVTYYYNLRRKAGLKLVYNQSFIGNKHRKPQMNKVNYTGELSTKSIDAFCKENSKGCYLMYQTIFSEVVITKKDKLPSSKHSANDWKNGYYHNGKRFDWSEARKITAQNAGNTKD